MPAQSPATHPPSINVPFSKLLGANYVKDRNLFLCNKSHITQIIQKKIKNLNHVQNRP